MAIPDAGAIAASATWPPELSDPTFASDRRCFIVDDPASRGECRASRPTRTLVLCAARLHDASL